MLRGWKTYSYISPELGRENYWIGTTVEDQARADERIPHLLDIPASTRFLSCEPLLGPLNIRQSWDQDGNSYDALTGDIGVDGRGHTGPRNERVHWVIVGGESGSGHRHFDPAWARSIRDQCATTGTPFHMKQMGGLRPSTMPPIPEDLLIRQWPALT
jgi:protein gp37